MLKFWLLLLCLLSCTAAVPHEVLGAAVDGEEPQEIQERWFNPEVKSTILIELRTFDAASVRGFTEKLKELDGGAPYIYVRINSNGGSISGGQDVIHALEDMKSSVACVVDWKAYSMGFFTLQSDGCDIRLMTKRATLMAHEPGLAETGGTAGELRDAADMLDALNESFISFAAERMQMEVDDFREKTERRNWWLDWRQAFEAKAIDGLVDPRSLPPATPYVIKKSLFETLFSED